MGKKYASFFIRVWRDDGGVQRIKIEHVQSGLETHVATLAAAIAWIDLHWDEASSNLILETEHERKELTGQVEQG